MGSTAEVRNMDKIYLTNFILKFSFKKGGQGLSARQALCGKELLYHTLGLVYEWFSFYWELIQQATIMVQAHQICINHDILYTDI